MTHVVHFEVHKTFRECAFNGRCLVNDNNCMAWQTAIPFTTWFSVDVGSIDGDSAKFNPFNMIMR